MADDYSDRGTTRSLKPTRGRRRSRSAAFEREPSLAGLWLGRIARLAIPVLLLCALTVGVAYVRLSQGPVSLPYLTTAIVKGVEAELGGLALSVGDTRLEWASSGLQVRLIDLKLANGSVPVARAPAASVTLSTEALWSGLIAPERVVLIEPRMLAIYEPGRGFSLNSESGAADAARHQAPEPRPAAAAPAGPALPDEALHVDLARAIADAAARARRKQDAASYLEEIGVLDATLVLDQGGRQGFLRVPQASLSLDHRKKRSSLLATATVATATGPFEMRLNIEESEKFRTVSVRFSLTDFVARTIARTLPALNPLESFEFPLSGSGEIELSSTGEILSAKAALDAGKGRIRLAEGSQAGIDVDRGRLNLAFDPAAGVLRMQPSTLDFSSGHVVLAGTMQAAEPAAGRNRLAFQIAASEGAIPGHDGKQVAVQDFRLAGTLEPDTGEVQLQEVVLGAGGASLALSGGMAAGGGYRLEGRIASAPIDALLAFWPSGMADEARRWVAVNVPVGSVSSGTVQLAAGGEQSRSAVALELAGLNVAVAAGVSAQIPRALLRMEGPSLEIAAPEGAIRFADNRRLAFRTVRLLSDDVFAVEPRSELQFVVNGHAAAALDLLRRQPFDLTINDAITPHTVEGTIEGDFKLTFGRSGAKPFALLSTAGRARIADGRARKGLAGKDLSGIGLVIDLADKTVEAKGDLLVSGVPARLDWRHVLQAPPDRQPPLRLSARLDNTDRTQLGLEINDLIEGEMPLEVAIENGAKGEPRTTLRADLSKASITLESLSWHKAPGREAILEFEFQKGARYAYELTNLRLLGEDIAAEGWIGLDQGFNVREFAFPTFTLDIVSKLDLHGKLGAGKVWQVKVEGPTFDGRKFFRSLFSVGQVRPSGTGAKPSAGIDLTASIATVLGYGEASLRNVRLQLSKREGRLTELVAHGNLEGGGLLEAGLQQPSNRSRSLVALSDDAGKTFRLVGFYPNMRGGRMRLEVDLDGRGAAEKTGTLRVSRFDLLGDPVISDLLEAPEDAPRARKAGRGARLVREVIPFDTMRVPFSVGHGQFVLADAELRGPVLGATIRGKADFAASRLDLGGTYVPLQALNAVFATIPGIGQLLTGPRGEGVFAINFAVTGPMDEPQVLVHPFSMIAPGIFREMFQLTNPNPRVTPRSAPGSARSGGAGSGPRASSSLTVPEDGQKAGQRDAIRKAPEVLGGWSSQTSPAAPEQPQPEFKPMQMPQPSN